MDNLCEIVWMHPPEEQLVDGEVQKHQACHHASKELGAEWREGGEAEAGSEAEGGVTLPHNGVRQKGG